MYKLRLECKMKFKKGTRGPCVVMHTLVPTLWRQRQAIYKVNSRMVSVLRETLCRKTTTITKKIFKRPGIVTHNCNSSFKEAHLDCIREILSRPKRETKQNQKPLKWGKEYHCVDRLALNSLGSPGWPQACSVLSQSPERSSPWSHRPQLCSDVFWTLASSYLWVLVRLPWLFKENTKC